MPRNLQSRQSYRGKISTLATQKEPHKRNRKLISRLHHHIKTIIPRKHDNHNSTKLNNRCEVLKNSDMEEQESKNKTEETTQRKLKAAKELSRHEDSRNVSNITTMQ